MNDYQLTSLVFSALIIILFYAEKLRLKKIITPFTLTAIPFVIIILITNFFLIDLKFLPVTMRAQYFILGQLLILWICGYIIASFFKIENILVSNSYSEVSHEFKDYSIVLVIISWLTIFVIFRKVLSIFALHGGPSYFGYGEYEKVMSRGIVAHVLQVSRVCFLFLLFVYKKSIYKKLILLSLFGLFLAISALQIKYHILWLILMAFIFYNAENSQKKQIKNLAVASIVLLLVFNLFWVILTIAWGIFGLSSEKMWLYIGQQTANYFVSGAILLDKWLNYPNIRPDWILIIVPKNFYNMIMGNPIRYDFVPLVSIGFKKVAQDVYSNVGTAYGTFYLIGGWSLTIAVTVIVSILSYIMYFLSYLKNNYFIIFLNLLFLTIGTLMFFGQYFTSLSTYEMPVILVAFGGFFKFANFVRNKISKKRISQV